MTDVIRINDTIHSWNSVVYTFDFVPYVGITATSYADKLETETVNGATRNGVPLGTTSGKYSTDDVPVTMLRASAYILMRQMTIKGLGSYGDARFTINIQIIERGDVHTVTMSTCRITGVKETEQEGTGALVTEVNIKPLSIKRDGMQLWSLERSIGL